MYFKKNNSELYTRYIQYNFITKLALKKIILAKNIYNIEFCYEMYILGGIFESNLSCIPPNPKYNLLYNSHEDIKFIGTSFR